jgi:hypothetical protein
MFQLKPSCKKTPPTIKFQHLQHLQQQLPAQQEAHSLNRPDVHSVLGAVAGDLILYEAYHNQNSIASMLSTEHYCSSALHGACALAQKTH